MRIGGFVEMLADAAQPRAEPEEGGLRGVDEGEDGLAGGGGDELAKLCACELKKGGRLFGAAKALENRERGQQCGRGGRAEIDLDLQRDGVARGGGGEIGRQKQAEHRNTVSRVEDEARRKSFSSRRERR